MKAVVLAGGGGTRLWPLSTLEKPKQFQAISSEKTMLEETLDRINFLKPEEIFLAINEKHLELVKQLCPQIPIENIIIEPALRDTASCIGYAAAIIEAAHPGEVMAVIYADHLIQEKEVFKEKLQKAEEIANKENTLNIIEVVAKEPNVNFGYVKLGKQLEKDVYEIDSFTEKPDKPTAEQFLADGNYLWNTGIYVWKSSLLLEQFKQYTPESFEKFQKMIENPNDVQKIYPTLDKISIDYAIMEKVDPSLIRIIKADLGWCDLGTWESVHKELTNSPTENLTRGPVKLVDCEGCIVYANNQKEIRAVGLKNMVIIDTPDGQLNCHISDSNRVKELQK
jgi:mannose-1-phosphate guanylyltransferase